MSEALIYAIFALFVFGTYDYLIVKPARRIPVLHLALYLSVWQFLTFTLLFLFFWDTLKFSWQLIYPIFGGIFGVSGIIFFSKSLQTGLAWISSSIANAYPLITIFIGALFFKEHITSIQYLFFSIIILGIFFLSFQISEIKSLKLTQCKTSLLYAFWAMITWAGFVTFFDISIIYYWAINTIMIAEFGNIFLLSTLLFFHKNSLSSSLSSLDKKTYIDVVKVLICSLFWIFLFAKAFEAGWSLSVVSAITASSPVMTTLLARIFLNEKLNTVQYWAIFILITWVVGLSYVSL